MLRESNEQECRNDGHGCYGQDAGREKVADKRELGRNVSDIPTPIRPARVSYDFALSWFV